MYIILFIVFIMRISDCLFYIFLVSFLAVVLFFVLDFIDVNFYKG